MGLLIAISGFSGGDKGPQEIYRHLEKPCQSDSINILRYKTLPNDLQRNINHVSELALKSFDSFKNIYLVGHSMGGAIAVLAAHQLNRTHPGKVKGLVLIDTQTDGLAALNELTIPVLFYHGKEDQIFQVWEIRSIYEKYKGPKRMVEIKDLDHDLARISCSSKSKAFSQGLALDLFSEISDFFSSLDMEKQEITTREITLAPKRKIREKLRDLFRKKSI